MRSIRRIYVYLVAFLSLAMLATAAANLLQLLVDAVAGSPQATPDYVREQVSLWGAAALVALPVFVIHWLLAQRSARRDGQDRASALRRLYLYAVLAGAVLVGAGALRDSLEALVEALAEVLTTGSALVAIVRPLPIVAVAAVVWTAHFRTVRSDRIAVAETGASASLRRWYTFGVAFVGLLLLLQGASGLLESLWLAAVQQAAGLGFAVASSVANVSVGLLLWLLHWAVLAERRVVAEDRGAVLRGVYLFLALAVSVGGTLLAASQLLFYALGRALGVADPGGVGGSLLQAAAGPVSILLVYGTAWAYQRRVIGREDLRAGQVAVQRLYAYLVSLIALAVLATGVAGLLWTLGDLVVGGVTASTTADWRGQLALFATLAVVGLPVWLVQHLPRRGDAGSLARRLYLYLVLIASVLTLLGSLAATVYRVLAVFLGADLTNDPLFYLVHALALAVVAGAVGIYHWRLLRRDERAPVTTDGPTAPADLVVALHARDMAILEQALASLRASGVTVDILQPTT